MAARRRDDEVVQSLAAPIVAPSHRHGDVERERKVGGSGVWGNGREIEGSCLACAKYPASGPQTIAASTSPCATASTMRAGGFGCGSRLDRVADDVGDDPAARRARAPVGVLA